MLTTKRHTRLVSQPSRRRWKGKWAVKWRNSLKKAATRKKKKLNYLAAAANLTRIDPIYFTHIWSSLDIPRSGNKHNTTTTTQKRREGKSLRKWTRQMNIKRHINQSQTNYHLSWAKHTHSLIFQLPLLCSNLPHSRCFDFLFTTTLFCFSNSS